LSPISAYPPHLSSQLYPLYSWLLTTSNLSPIPTTYPCRSGFLPLVSGYYFNISLPVLSSPFAYCIANALFIHSFC